MIGWIGFIGKTIEFVCKKLADGTLDHRLSVKHRACRQFIRFRDVLREVEGVASDLDSVIEPVADGTRTVLYSPQFGSLEDRIATCTEAFFDSFSETAPIIHLYDPTLTACFGRLTAGKAGLVYIASQVLTSDYMKTVFERKDTKFRGLDRIKYTLPSKDLSLDDFQRLYLECHDRHGSRRRMDPGEDDEDVLGKLLGRPEEDQITRESIAEISRLHQRLASHKREIRTGREALDHFIRTHFSMEDLLRVLK